ncbi:Purple acid phosphatase 3, partial [Mucuna pruriens]
MGIHRSKGCRAMVAILTFLRISNMQANSYGSVSFLMVGEWGRKGSHNQSLVAFQMGVIGEKLDIDFVISRGDNFYDNGLTGLYDPAFEESFAKIYTAPSLQKKWYNENVDFFFVDATPFVSKYFIDTKAHSYDWRGILPRKRYISKLLKK